MSAKLRYVLLHYRWQTPPTLRAYRHAGMWWHLLGRVREFPDVEIKEGDGLAAYETLSYDQFKRRVESGRITLKEVYNALKYGPQRYDKGPFDPERIIYE